LLVGSKGASYELVAAPILTFDGESKETVSPDGNIVMTARTGEPCAGGLSGADRAIPRSGAPRADMTGAPEGAFFF
jgi:hypothetical protein